ncbi:hypothetical protein RB653_006689 [Dictyostelium firmibasis]|uniref:Uncharacterized protein n=1 Tax=Dictyostelium firmibasis TaxID=79012 RepID=A0AAN7YQB2_9MYCE
MNHRDLQKKTKRFLYFYHTTHTYIYLYIHTTTHNKFFISPL